MALTLGTNCGFVTTAPTADPAGGFSSIDGGASVMKHTSPATATKITEIGWWCDTASEEANFEVGLYAADGAVVPGEAGTRLFVSATNAKGTTAGWKVVTGLNWTISPSTAYWIGVQLDDVATATDTNFAASGGAGYDKKIGGQTTLTDPFGGGALQDADGMLSFYAVWEAAGTTGSQMNIGDAWKQISGAAVIKINIGDVWKDVSGAWINIGDVWKAVTIK